MLSVLLFAAAAATASDHAARIRRGSGARQWQAAELMKMAFMTQDIDPKSAHYGMRNFPSRSTARPWSCGNASLIR
jgi:hypothetical protein